MKILIHKTDHLGDFVLALPALWELRQKFGATAEIHQLVGGANIEWQLLLPWLGTLHPLIHPRYERRTKVPKLTLSARALQQTLKLRPYQFDWGIDLVSTRNDLLGKWLLHASGCAQTSGPDGAHSWMLSRAYPEPNIHQTRLLAQRFPAEWKIKGEAAPEAFMPEEFRWEPAPSNSILLAPFAGTLAKRWPNKYWVKLYQELSREVNVNILIPAPDLKNYGTFLSNFSKENHLIVNNLRETLKLLKSAKGAVVLDTGVAHFCWLTGTPFVQLFSGTSKAERWAPHSGGVTIQKKPDCYPCHSGVCLKIQHQCMETITVQDVMKKIKEEMLCQ